MNLRQATAADADRLKDFFETTTLPGSIDFTVLRPASFFDHYRLISDDFETVILEDDDGAIAGLATLVFRKGYVLGEPRVWAFATDLRIAPTRRAIAQWAQHYVPLLERVFAERGCHTVLSAVEQHDLQAYNALIRPTSHARRRLPRYLLANRFRVVALHGRVPFSARPLASLNIKPLSASDIEEVCAYMHEQSLRRPLASSHTPDNFFAELARWPGISLNDFRIVRDGRSRIRGVAALYDARQTQSLVPRHYHGFALTAFQLLRIASFTGLVRPPAPTGRVMPVRFLSHCHCDNPEVFHTLVDDAYSRLGPRELLAYLHFRGNWRTLPPQSFVATSLPFGLFQVLSPNAEATAWPQPNLEVLPPEFEAAWL